MARGTTEETTTAVEVGRVGDVVPSDEGQQQEEQQAVVGPPAERSYDRFRTALVNRRDEFVKALGPGVDADVFIEVCTTAYLANKDLQKAHPVSLYSALRKAAQLRLRPDGEEGYVEVWYDKEDRCYKATFHPMYKGLIRTLTRGGQVQMVDAQVVRTGDDFDYRLGDDPFIRHKPERDPDKRGEIDYCYAIFYLANGLKLREVMSREEMDDLRENAKARRREGPAWRTNPDQMYRKMPIKRGSKFLDLAPREAAVFAYDNALERGERDAEPGDSIPEADWRTLDERADDHAQRQKDELRDAMDRMSGDADETEPVAGDPLDRVIEFGKHADGELTWRSLLSTNEGYGYVKHAIVGRAKHESVTPALRSALADAVEAGPPEATVEQIESVYADARTFADELEKAGQLTDAEREELDLLRHDRALAGLLELKEEWRARLEEIDDEIARAGDDPQLDLR